MSRKTPLSFYTNAQDMPCLFTWTTAEEEQVYPFHTSIIKRGHSYNAHFKPILTYTSPEIRSARMFGTILQYGKLTWAWLWTCHASCLLLSKQQLNPRSPIAPAAHSSQCVAAACNGHAGEHAKNVSMVGPACILMLQTSRLQCS